MIYEDDEDAASPVDYEYTLTIVNKKGLLFADSRQVAEIIGKSHSNLLSEIRSHSETLPNSDYLFIESQYTADRGRKCARYLITKFGCDIITDKFKGPNIDKFGKIAVQAFMQAEEEVQLNGLVCVNSNTLPVEQTKELSKASLDRCDSLERIVVSLTASVVDLTARVAHMESIFKLLRGEH